MAPRVRAAVPLSVICVEDDVDMVELLRISVEGEPDFELVATTGEASAVLELIRTHHPDVVILDHCLSDDASSLTRRPRGVALAQTGLELVEGTRVAAPDATIVIFTGRRGLGPAARNVGADACVEKPALDAVWSAVREARASK